MFLRNYYNLIARVNLGRDKVLSSDAGFGSNSLNIKCTDGHLLTGGWNNSTYGGGDIPLILDRGIVTSDYPGIVLGTGNEPVTFDDYKLGTLLTKGFTTSSVGTSNYLYNEVSNKFYATSKFTLSNTSNENIIIREYGISCYAYMYGGASYGNGWFLIFRELLEPYTIEPSESVNMILNVSYTMPTIDESGNVVAGSQAYGLNIE